MFEIIYSLSIDRGKNSELSNFPVSDFLFQSMVFMVALGANFVLFEVKLPVMASIRFNQNTLVGKRQERASAGVAYGVWPPRVGDVREEDNK